MMTIPVRYCPACGTLGGDSLFSVRCCPEAEQAMMLPAEIAKQAYVGFQALIADYQSERLIQNGGAQ